MMEDLELINLASKASGFEYTNNSNPLNDDALALRLAVKLKMSMALGSSGFRGPTTWVRATGLITEKTQYHEGDPYAATRRAIVMSAAEIGRGMK